MLYINQLALCAAFALFGVIHALPGQPAASYELRLIHQFPNFTWIENMNGQILANDVSNGTIYLIDPLNPPTNPPVVAVIPNNTHIAGITEVEDDIFYTVGDLGDLYKFTSIPNSTTVWEVDMRPYTATGLASIRKVAEMPLVIAPNGACTLSKEENIILIADSSGFIWSLNVKTGSYEIFLDDPLLKPIATATPPFGVNGIHIVNSTLYFTNTNHGYLGYVSLSTSTHAPAGPAKLITSLIVDADDFAIGPTGSFWVTRNVDNTLVRVFPDGDVQHIAGGVNSTALIGPVAASFGRTWRDSSVLYVSTDGLSEDSEGKFVTTAGKIVAIDTKQWTNW